MKKFLSVFSLETKAIVRSGLFAGLLVFSVLWMVVLPLLIRGDGTAEGARELYVRFSLGGVFVLLAISLLASATGAVAGERTAKRLQLTLVRPVGGFSVALGKVAANVFAGAAVLAVSAAVLLFKVDGSVRCDRVLSPILPSPAEEAAAMYEVYMNDPDTPPEVKRAKKSVVMRLLTNRAVDHYQTVQTNDSASWKFRLSGPGELSVRMRFTNQFDMRQDLLGEFVMDGNTTAVSNITQAILKVPLVGGAGIRTADSGAEKELRFFNRGKTSVMLRPRRNMNLLVKADTFRRNLLRAWLELVSVLTLLVSAGVFLSSGLGRPVALFVALATLLVGEMSPGVISQYPDELETKTADRIGLTLTRFSAELTRPFSSISPLESLSKDECIETDEVVRAVLSNCVAAPLLFCLLAAFLMPRKQD